MKKIGAFFRLVRWPNLLIIALMMCLVYHNLTGMHSMPGFTLLVISMVLIVAGGYVVNDIFDKEIDEINKPEKLIVERIFTEKQCKVFYWSLTIIGLAFALASTLITFGKDFLTIFACMLLLACVLFSYSNRYKKKLVVGNVIVSLSVAFAVFLPWLFVMLYLMKNEFLAMNYEVVMHISLRLVLIYSAFAFVITLMREIVKDMEDVDGDGLSHCRTIPIIWGMKIAQIIVLLLSVLTIFGIFFAGNALEREFGMKFVGKLLRWSSLPLVFPLTVGLIINLFGKQSGKTTFEYYFSPTFYSKALKISMLIGVLSMIFVK